MVVLRDHTYQHVGFGLAAVPPALSCGYMAHRFGLVRSTGCLSGIWQTCTKPAKPGIGPSKKGWRMFSKLRGNNPLDLPCSCSSVLFSPLCAGLSDVLAFLNTFSFSECDIAYLRKALPECDAAFFAWLGKLDCKGIQIYALEEGTLCFPRIPLIRVEVFTEHYLEPLLHWYKFWYLMRAVETPYYRTIVNTIHVL